MNGDTTLIIQEIKEFRKEYQVHKDHITKELQAINIKLAKADLEQLKKDVRSFNIFKIRAVAVFTLIQTIIIGVTSYFYKIK